MDDFHNIMRVCRVCHESGEVNAWEARVWFWQQRCKKYGRDEMVRWHETVRLKKKSNFEGGEHEQD